MGQHALLRRLAPLGAFLIMAALPVKAAIADGMNAENILGQLDDSDAPVWTTNVPNYRPTAQGFDYPMSVALDTATHRLFVSEYYNNRVLEFDLDSSNNLVDHTADHVLGQTTFTGFQYRNTQNGMNTPYGVAIDPGTQRLFVSDTNNNRVIVFDVSSLSDGQNAAYVLGQTNFTLNSSATTQGRMYRPHHCSYDGLNNRLYVADRANNRVLVYDVSTITNGQNAIFVLGQPDFTSNATNTTQNGMSAPYVVEFATATQKLFVADYTNNRVLVYEVASLSDGMNASYVIGQTDFNSNATATTQSGLNGPHGLAFDAGTNRLFVDDFNNSRVLVFDVNTGADGPNAVNVLGQTDFTTGYTGRSQSRFANPRGLAFDQGNNRMYLADSGNQRVIYFNVSAIVNGQNAEDGLGVQDGAGTYNWTMGVYNTPPNARGMSEALDVVLDTSSHRLFISDSRNSRVLGFDLDSNDTIVDRVADHVLGQTTFGNASKNATQNKFYFPIGLDFDPAGRRLFVGDGYNNRILIYDLSGGISDGQNAAHVIGQTNFTNSGTGITQNQLCLPRGLRYDPSLNRLYVADTSNNRVMVFNVSNVTDGMNAINVLGQPDFTTNSVGITQNKMTTPYGLSLDIPGQRLFVAENSGNRVTVFNVSSLANGQNAMNVLGQADFTSSGAATARNGMNAPFGVTHDPVSGRLYVSDYNNNRVLVFDGKTLSNGQNAANVLGQSNFTSGSFATTQNGLYRPTLLTIDSSHHRLFVPEFSNRRVTTFLVDLAPSTSTLTAVTGSSSGQVALSWPSAGDEESQGNLTGNYRIQYATYTATWSNSTTPTNATTLTISTTNAVPGVVQSTTVAGLTTGNMYYFALFTQDNQSNWSDVSNTASAMPPWTVTAAEAVSQPGWIGQGETQRILGTAQVVSDSAAGVTISSVAVRETGAYTGDGNLTNVEVWVSSTGYIDGTAVRLEDASKSFSGDIVAFDQDVTVSTVPLYFIVRADVAGGATEGTFDISMEVYTTANTTNNPLAFTNATDVVAPPSGSPAGLTATAASNLLQVNLSWGAVSGADSYSIFRATYSGVTTADYLLSLTNATTLPDDYIPPTQQMYYKVIATNRAGASSLSNEANATSVDVSALTPNNIYLRAGAPGGYNTGQPAFQQFLSLPGGVFVDMAGNVYISNSLRIYFIPKISGTHFGQSMMANSIYTIAGWLYSGYAGDGGLATSARLNSPQSAIADSAGNVYIADTYNHRIRFVAKTNGTFFGQAMTANNIYTIVGNGIGGYVADDVAATSAQINSPNHVALDVAGNLFISDTNNNRIRFVPKTSGAYFGQSMTANNIYSIAGNGTGGYVADDVAATSTQINAPGNIAVDVTGNLYIADMANHRIRFVPKASGTSFGQAMIANNIYTIAGNGTSGYLADNVAATSTRINNPYGLCVDPNGNITIADKNNHRIRFIPKLSGTNFGQSMTANNIYTIAGNGSSGIVTITDNVTATATRLNGPKGVSTDAAGNIYIADTDSWSRIRMVPKITSNYFGQSMTAGYIYTLAGGVVGYDGEGNIATATRYAGGLMGGVDSNGNIQIVDTTNFRIRFVPKTTGTFFGQSMVANCAYTIAGTGIYTFNNDGGVATTAGLRNPIGASFDSSGNVYIADRDNARIRFIPKSDGTYFGQSRTANHMYTLVGDGTAAFSGDGGPAVSAQISGSQAITVDRDGNLYIADSNNQRIRFIPAADGTYFGQAMTTNYIYTIAGNGSAGYLADNVSATSTQINNPSDVRVDASGNVVIADKTNSRIRFIPTTDGTYFGQSMTANYIYTIAGNSVGGYADNGLATARQLASPSNVDIDVAKNLYIADTLNHRIRFVPNKSGTYFGQAMTANFIYTVVGNGTSGYNGENAVATSKYINSPNALFLTRDHCLYISDANSKIRMIKADDFISPSTSTLTAVPGSTAGTIDLTWPTAGDDMVNLGNLTGNYRIQYATYTASWSTGSTPSNATMVTISTTNATPGSPQSYVATGLAAGLTYYFVLWSGDEVPNWSDVSNTALVYLPPPAMVTLAEAVGQPGWIGQGETQRILGTAQVVSDSAAGVTVSSVTVRETGAYTGDSNLTNVEVWVSSSGYIDGTAVRLDDASKSFSGDIVAFDQDVTVSTVPLYYIVRADVAGGATEGTFDISMEVYTTANTTNSPLAFSNATDVVAPPSGSPAGLTATAEGNLLRVNLSWSGASGADSYSIFRATHAGVTTTDFLLGVTNATAFADNFIPPNQQMYYQVVGTNRAGASSLSGAASATSVDIPALALSNIYLRAGSPGGTGAENMPQQLLVTPWDTFVDNSGNLYAADGARGRIRFVPKVNGTYFGQAMIANVVYSIAGNGNYSFAGDGGIATAGRMKSPRGVTVDGEGNVYIADTENNRVRFVPKTTGTFFGQAMTADYIYTIAGNGTGGYMADNVAATATQISLPYGLSVDVGGNLHIADYGNHRIRFVPKTTGTFFGQAMTANYIYTIAGNGTGGYVTDNVAATATPIYNPYSVSVDAAGNVYVADSSNQRIRFVPRVSGTYFEQPMTANYIYTIAGNGTAGYQADNVAATATRINTPRDVTLDVHGHIYIADTVNQRVRMIPKTSGTFFGQSMTANSIYTIAGNGTGGYISDNVAATITRLSDIAGVSVDLGGNVYIASYGGGTVGNVRFVPKSNGANFGQSMTANYIYRIIGFRTGYSGDGGLATMVLTSGLTSVSVDSSGNMFIVDTSNFRVRFVPKTSGTYYGQSMVANSVYTIAGSGSFTFDNDGGLATTAGLKNPNSVYVHSSGNIFIADSANQRIRFIPKLDGTYFGQSWTANHMYTLTGDGTATYGGDGGPAVSGKVSPRHVSTDRDGNVYIADTNNHRIRFIPLTDGTYFGVSMTANYIYTIAGNGTGGYVADNVAATSTPINTPWGVNVDYLGNIYISDTENHRVRFIPKSSGTYFNQSMTANYIYTIVGNGVAGYLADNVVANATRINQPYRTSIDSGGNVYVADRGSSRIRFVPKRNGTYFGQSMTADYIYTIGGSGSSNYDGENTPATGKGISLPSDVYVSEDHKVYMVDVNEKVRMIAGEDFIAPSTSTLAATAGVGEVTLNWNSAGDDNVTLGNLTGNYRIQYATYTASWSTGSTPSNATTVTISTTNATPGSPQTYTATGLTGGSTYYFVLWTGDEVPNWSDVSNTASVLLTPSAPSTGAITARSQTTLTAGWAFSLGTSSYTFVASTAPDNPPVAVVGSSVTADLSGTVNALTPNTTYFGFVNACNGAGCSAYRAVGSTVTWANPPVSLSTTTMGTLSATLIWDSNSNPAGTVYVVETATEPGGSYTVSFSTVEVTALLTGLSPGTPACYRVVANSWDNVPTTPSNELCLVPAYTDPGAGSLTTVSEGSIRGDWGSADGATSYTLRLSTMADNPPVDVAGSDTTAGLNTTIAGLTANTTYYGFVTGCNANGCSANTFLGSTVTLANPATSLSTTTLTSLTATLGWTANSNPTGTRYRLERSTWAGGGYSLEMSTSALTVGVTGLAPGETACFRVIAQSHGGVDAAASNELCLVPAYTDPGAGSLTTVDASSIRGDWGSADGATSYTLRLSTMADNPPVAVAGSDTTAGLNTTIAGLTANTTYYGFVTGCNASGCSANTVLGSTVTMAAVPQGLVSSGLTGVGVTVSFSGNGNPLGTNYEIERAQDGGAFVQVLVTTQTTVPFTGLIPGASYDVRVRAVSHGGVASGYSGSLSFTTIGAGPVAIVNLRGMLGGGGITYSWDPVTRDTDGGVLSSTVTYRLLRSNSPSGPFTTEWATTTGTLYGLALSPPPHQYLVVQVEHLNVSSSLSAVIDNVDGGRYVYASSVGNLAVAPQGLLTGLMSERHTVAVESHIADGGGTGFEVTVVNPSNGSAGDVTFSPVGELTMPLAGATGGVRAVEKWMGSRWSLVGSAQVGPPGIVTVTIPRTGIYRVTGAPAGGPLVREVYNRSFSPNGDGRAESVVFRLENPENLPMEGAIYSSENMHVADMAEGPIPGLTLTWDGRARHGAMCEGGIYTYEITVGGRRTNGIVVLLK